MEHIRSFQCFNLVSDPVMNSFKPVFLCKKNSFFQLSDQKVSWAKGCIKENVGSCCYSQLEWPWLLAFPTAWAHLRTDFFSTLYMCVLFLTISLRKTSFHRLTFKNTEDCPSPHCPRQYRPSPTDDGSTYDFSALCGSEVVHIQQELYFEFRIVVCCQASVCGSTPSCDAGQGRGAHLPGSHATTRAHGWRVLYVGFCVFT